MNTILGGDTQLASQMLMSIASVFLKSANEAGNDTSTLDDISEVSTHVKISEIKNKIVNETWRERNEI